MLPICCDEIHELIGAEGIGIDDIAPGRIHGGRALVAGADSLAPVILVGKAAAGPADVGHLEFLEGGHYVVADSASVGDG